MVMPTVPPPPPPNAASNAKPKSRIIVISALIVGVVAVLIATSAYFVVSRNLSNALEDSVRLLQVSLSEASEVRSHLDASLAAAGGESSVTVFEGAQSGEPGGDEHPGATDLNVDPAAVAGANKEREELSALILSGEDLLSRAGGSTGSKRALVKEVKAETEALDGAIPAARDAADTLDGAVEKAVLDAAKVKWQNAKDDLNDQVQDAKAMLTDSEWMVEDDAVRVSLSASIAAAEQLLDNDPTVGADAAEYSRLSEDCARRARDLSAGTAVVSDAMTAKAEADRIAAEQAEAERLAAEQAEADRAAAAAPDEQIPERTASGGCRWPVEDPETGWSPVWKVQGWCEEEDFWDAVGCARGWYPGCDER